MVAEHLLQCWQAGGGAQPWHQRALDMVPLEVLGLVRLGSPSLESQKRQTSLEQPHLPMSLAVL